MPVLTITYGLPGCGKTTWANNEVKNKKSQTIILCRDDIRQMIAGSHDQYRFNSGNEDYVSTAMEECATEALKRGWNVIIADTNLNIGMRLTWERVAAANNAILRVKDFYKDFLKDNSLHDDYFGQKAFLRQCKERNLKRTKIVEEEIIDGMFAKYFTSTLKVPFNDPRLPEAVIFDIDGTLASHEGIRSPYDHEKVLQDTPNQDVIEMVAAEIRMGRKVFIMSGRKDICRADTMTWLANHGVQYENLYMRATDDSRSDDIVKYELYMQHMHGVYFTQKVYDDRNKVCDMWRDALHLRVFQVAPGNF